ncbi:MAG: polymerase sigma-70 factor, subfamily [Actinomycetota bacterium]|nr:polymerase sigma-70 factor, subfamily [Actinomycetota bacterium]
MQDGARGHLLLREALASHGPAVNGIARRILVDPHLAEDVTQETFIAWWTNRDRFDPARGDLRAYLCGLARNKAIDLVRREETQRRTKDTLARRVPEAPDDATAGVLERLQMLPALKALTALQLEALTLAYFGGRTYKEVALELGIPEGTAKTRLRDGLTAMRTYLTTPAQPLAG